MIASLQLTLRENCPYLEFFWENKDQKNSEYGYFSSSVDE